MATAEQNVRKRNRNILQTKKQVEPKHMKSVGQNGHSCNGTIKGDFLYYNFEPFILPHFLKLH